MTIAALARGEPAPDTLDANSANILENLHNTRGDKSHTERGLVALALDDGRVAISEMVAAVGTSDSVKIDWSLFLGDSPGTWRAPPGRAVVGALLVHVHPISDQTFGTPSLGSLAENNTALSGDFPYLLGANYKGVPEGVIAPDGRELPLGVPTAIATLTATGASANVMSGGAITQEQSDSAFDALMDRALKQWTSWTTPAKEAGISTAGTGNPLKPPTLGFGLDNEYTNISSMSELFRLIQNGAAPIPSLTIYDMDSIKAGSRIRARPFGLGH